MRDYMTMRFAVPLIAACGVLFPLCTAAFPQDTQAPQDQSVADAARQARAQKKNATKALKVISDDDIDTKKVKPGAEGLNVGSQPKSDSQPPNPAAVAAAEAADAAAASAENGSTQKKGDDPEIARAKEQVAEVAKQLDLLQRGAALDQDSFYSKPNYVSDKDGKARLDAEQQQVNEARQQLDRLKAHLAELEEARNRKKTASGESSGSPAGEKPAETAPATPPQS
jgi:hypothetical protein